MSKLSIRHLEINNFKGIDSLSLDLRDNVNVFIGANGMGKSSILFGLSMALSRFIGRLKSLNSNGILFDKGYIKNDANESSIETEMIYAGKEIQWKIGKQRYQTKQTITNLEKINQTVLKINESLQKDSTFSLPVIVFYGVGRNVLDVPLKIKTKHQFDQLSAYDGALLNERSVNDFRLFFEWFRGREDIENEKLREFSLNSRGIFQKDFQLEAQEDFRDAQLEAVRSAVQEIIPDFANLRVKRTPLRMVLTKKIQKKEIEIQVDLLSDGEKCTLSMVGDLARRLSIANPSLSNPLKGDGIVIIDEIDLHLHPSWEISILPKLQKTFPNCQFIVSTHSPLVLSQQKADSIFLLTHDEEGKIEFSHPKVANGLTANEILDLLMNAPNMSPAIKDAIDKIYSAIEKEKWDEATNQIAEIRKNTGADVPELTKVETYLSLCREN